MTSSDGYLNINYHCYMNVFDVSILMNTSVEGISITIDVKLTKPLASKIYASNSIIKNKHSCW